MVSAFLSFITVIFKGSLCSEQTGSYDGLSTWLLNCFCSQLQHSYVQPCLLNILLIYCNSKHMKIYINIYIYIYNYILSTLEIQNLLVATKAWFLIVLFRHLGLSDLQIRKRSDIKRCEEKHSSLDLLIENYWSWVSLSCTLYSHYSSSHLSPWELCFTHTHTHTHTNELALKL